MKTTDYNYYDHYTDDVEDVHLVCSSWNPAYSKRQVLWTTALSAINLTASDDQLAWRVE
jgi:hypothetical protein